MIKFYVPKGVTRRASVRFRATVPLKGMREYKKTHWICYRKQNKKVSSISGCF